MHYNNVCEGRFVKRLNRFVAVVQIDGVKTQCHVKNTARCKELFLPGARVFLEDCIENKSRKTRYDVIAVYKGQTLVNIDSQAPNKVVGEYMEHIFPDVVFYRPETKYKNSRFDFYVETPEKKIFLEVKGVTLEEDGIVRFPDAPTERGVKHIKELIACRKEGYEAYIVFVIQMKGAWKFVPNDRTHPQFGEALKEAEKAGVHILCFDCLIKPDSMEISEKIPYSFTV